MTSAYSNLIRLVWTAPYTSTGTVHMTSTTVSANQPSTPKSVTSACDSAGLLYGR
jgi:hypothetical protein